MRRLGTLLLGVVLVVAVTGCATTGPDINQKAKQEAAKTNTQLGIRYLRKGDLQQALRKLNKALNENPDLGDAHMAMGVVYERLDDPDKAREHYRRAVELEPDNSSALNNYGRFLCDRGEYDHAEELFKKSAANPLYESPEVPLANAGLCAERAGRHQKAEDYFLKALRSNKRFPVALLNMAELRLDQGEPMSARGYYERYLSAAQQTARSLWLGIRIEHQLENPDAVASYSLLLRQKFPDSAQASELLEWERNGKL